MSEQKYTTGDTIVVFYFNSTTGKPNERIMEITEITDRAYHLKERSGIEYRYDIDTSELYRHDSTTDSPHPELFGIDTRIITPPQ